MLKKCLIANRGEIAVRIIRACNELGIKTVAVYSDMDADAPHVRLADESYPLGGNTPAESYLVQDKLISIAIESQCDCVHPGYGFLSENASFAQAVLDAGLTWVGPPPNAIHKMGLKTEARNLMKDAGVPLVPGFDSDGAGDDAFLEAAHRIGFPVMVKAAGGGGGKGIRIVRTPAELPDALVSARREAEKAFSNPRVFLEKYIESGRHIEVQVFADMHGNTIHLFERECSVQRRHQKIIEESPSPLLSAEQRQAIGEAGVKAAAAIGYVNAGTVEFIATNEGEFYFLEMNTRLQVEHPVTEMVTGVDLVQLQFRVASGEKLPFTQDKLIQKGHAIECRIYAEDPSNNFLPSTGEVLRFDVPFMPGVRVDSGIRAGSEITIHYDPMIAKVIVYAADRLSAIQRMQQVLSQTVILGVTTNIDFLLTLLNNRAFIAGEVDTAYIDANIQTILPEPAPLLFEEVFAAALGEMWQNTLVSTDGTGSDADRFSPWSRSDRFRLGQ